MCIVIMIKGSSCTRQKKRLQCDLKNFVFVNIIYSGMPTNTSKTIKKVSWKAMK